MVYLIVIIHFAQRPLAKISVVLSRPLSNRKWSVTSTECFAEVHSQSK